MGTIVEAALAQRLDDLKRQIKDWNKEDVNDLIGMLAEYDLLARELDLDEYRADDCPTEPIPEVLLDQYAVWARDKKERYLLLSPGGAFQIVAGKQLEKIT